MTKLKLGEIVNSVEALNELIKIKMPVKASYAITRTIKSLSSVLETYNEKRDELMKEFGTPVEGKDGNYTFSKENSQKFTDEIKKLLEVEEDINIHKLKVEDFGDTKIEPKLLVDFLIG